MITRPLDLASRLRPAPRLGDGLALFILNGILLGMFFMLFGSRSVLSPGLPVDFALPVMPGALAGAAVTPVVISIKHGSFLTTADGRLIQDPSFILTDSGRMSLAQLGPWLRTQAEGRTGLRLLVRADASVPMGDVSAILELGQAAGFLVQWAGEPAVAP